MMFSIILQRMMVTKFYISISPQTLLLKRNAVCTIVENLNLDGLFDTGAITSAISEADLKEIKLLSNEAIEETGPAPNFQTKVI